MRRLIRLCMIVLLALGALLTQVSTAAAGSVNVRDDAGALTAADPPHLEGSGRSAVAGCQALAPCVFEMRVPEVSEGLLRGVGMTGAGLR